MKPKKQESEFVVTTMNVSNEETKTKNYDVEILYNQFLAKKNPNYEKARM